MRCVGLNTWGFWFMFRAGVRLLVFRVCVIILLYYYILYYYILYYIILHYYIITIIISYTILFHLLIYLPPFSSYPLFCSPPSQPSSPLLFHSSPILILSNISSPPIFSSLPQFSSPPLFLFYLLFSSSSLLPIILF